MEMPGSPSLLSAITNELNLSGHWLSRANEQMDLTVQMRDYYNGKHPVKLNSTMRSILNMRGSEHWFGVNYCQVVVDEMRNRLDIETLQAEEAEGLQKYIDDLLYFNEFELLQTDTHLSMLRDGDSYIVCEWNNETKEVDLHINYKFNGIAGILPLYRDGRLYRAIKVIPVNEEQSEVILYKDDSVSYYIYSKENGLMSVGSQDWPVGSLPVIQFSNRKLQGEEYGKSELLGVAGLQDAINASVITAMGAGYLAGFPTAVYKAGSGSVPPKKTGPGTIIELFSDDPALLAAADFRYNEAPRFDSTMDLIKDLVQHVGNVASIPVDFGRERSAEAQKESSAKLLAKIQNLHRRLAPLWKEVIRTSVLINNHYGSSRQPDARRLTARWADVQVRNNLEIVDIWSAIYDAVFPLNQELAGQLFLRGTSEISKLSDSEIEGFDLTEGLRMMREAQNANGGGTAGGTGGEGRDAKGGSAGRGSAKEGKRGTPSNSEQLAGRGRRAKDARGGR